MQCNYLRDLFFSRLKLLIVIIINKISKQLKKLENSMHLIVFSFWSGKKRSEIQRDKVTEMLDT